MQNEQNDSTKEDAGTAPEFLRVKEDDGEWGDNRSGPRLDRFSEQLTAMVAGKVNQYFDIPIVKNARNKSVPKWGFNLKAANGLYGPDVVFKKRRMTLADGTEVLRVKRVK